LELDARGSYALTSREDLSYHWDQTDGPTTVAWSDPDAPDPVVTGLAFGQYSFRLTVTDGDGQQNSKELVIGAVPTDDKGVVIHDDPNIELVFGKLLRLGNTPWKWHDENHQDLSEAYGQLVTAAKGIWNADWTTPLSGTISTNVRNRTVIGTGTSFQTDFCGGPGNTTPSTNYMVLVVGTGPNAYPALLSKCDSDTQLTLATGEENGLPALTDVPYSRTLNGVWWGGAWNGVGGANNANYYDNVMAHYALYYRTGLTRYRDYARVLADRWYDSPFFLKGPYPRMWSLTGILWRAYEGGMHPWWDEKLHRALDTLSKSVRKTGTIEDLREETYPLTYLALASHFSPDTTRQADYRQALLDAAYNRWKPQQHADGYWLTKTYGYASWNGKIGKANVTQGSDIVTGVGTTASDTHPNSGWNSGRVGSCFYVAGDTEAYTVKAVPTATEVVLDRPYNGLTREAPGWQMNNLCGYGVQPFILGIAMSGWDYAFKVTGEPLMQEFLLRASEWIVNNGLQPSTRGLYYGRVFPNCEPADDRNANCAYNASSTSAIEASRFLNGEVLGALSSAYQCSGNTNIRIQTDKMFGAVFGRGGGPETDNIYATLLNASVNGCCPKNFGFFYGFGRSTNWPAVRVSTSDTSQDATTPQIPGSRSSVTAQ
jgi:hypothetical protein